MIKDEIDDFMIRYALHLIFLENYVELAIFQMEKVDLSNIETGILKMEFHIFEVEVSNLCRKLSINVDFSLQYDSK